MRWSLRPDVLVMLDVTVGLSAYALAKSLGVPLPRVNDIVREKRGISPEMAVLLSAYFGTSDRYWINLHAL